MKILIIFCFLWFSCFALSHEGHQKQTTENVQLVDNDPDENDRDSEQSGRPTSWLQWLGSFHLIVLHFPIALINMLFISELLLVWSRKQTYEFSSQFLVVSSAIFAPYTALLGLIYSYSLSYSGLMQIFLLWHMWLGIFTAIFAVGIAAVRYQLGRSLPYFFGLIILVLLVNLAGFFGGSMTFGPYQMLPPQT